jgi:hypothetical protein
MSGAVAAFDQKKAYHENARNARRVAATLSPDRRRAIAESRGITLDTALDKLEQDIKEAKLVGQFGAVRHIPDDAIQDESVAS